MTQEEKSLLFQDLCARLSYKPIVHAKWSYRETNGELKHKETDRKLEINDIYAIWDIKPYLRPMSSMTEEERKEFESLGWRVDELNGNAPWNHNSYNVFDGVDWLNSHHFDYRGLISKGLALEAHEGMYNIKEK